MPGVKFGKAAGHSGLILHAGSRGAAPVAGASFAAGSAAFH